MKLKNSTLLVGIFAAAGLTLATSNAFAQQRERPQGPPPEAIEACEGLAEGDSVSFESPHGDTLEGECQYMDDELVAVPKNGRPHH